MELTSALRGDLTVFVGGVCNMGERRAMLKWDSSG